LVFFLDCALFGIYDLIIVIWNHMELREFILIFEKQKKFFFGVVLLFLFGAWVWQKEQPVRFEATLLINIGRTSVSEATDYTYDSFYRLQADERFADTAVRWLASPRVVEDIYREAHVDLTELEVNDFKGAFSAARLSSQMITVKYTSEHPKTLEILSRAMVTVLNRYTDTLNTEVKGKNWFVVIGSDPVIRDARVTQGRAILAGLLLGFFVSFWTVLVRHYLSRK
jgi:uncharacterized protein involved in exopolysaccharide biosynthesis